MRKIIFTSFFIVLAVLAYSKNISIPENDKKFRELYDSAEVYFLYEDYKEALQLYLRLNQMQADNANTNFKIGMCYLYLPTYKTKAIPYLENAIKSVSPKYKENNSKEINAPIEAYFYLAKAYHLNYEFDKAIKMYITFKDNLGEGPNVKSAIEDVEHEIESCNVAKELLKKPLKADIKNLGLNINSPFADFSPVISLDEQTLVFTTRRPSITTPNPEKEPNGDFFEDIYISTLKNEKWTNAISIGENVNSTGHEAAVNLSADGRQILIYKDIAGNGNLYLSELEGDKWSSPKELGAPVNSTAWESHACISADNKYLFFVSNREGGYGGKDIYKCLRLPNGEWGPPQNIGDQINTKYDEDGVFIHPDGMQIFFASKGHKTMGGFDIFTSVINDENGFWSTPVNIGSPINTPDDEVFYITTADATRAYFSSDKEGGVGEKDIYMITYPEYEQRHITILIGKIININESDISDNKIHIIDISNNDTIQSLTANSKTGKYGANLPIGKIYKTVYYINGKKIFEEDLDATKKEGYKVITREVPYEGEPAAKPAPIPVEFPCDAKAASMIHYFGYNQLKLQISEEFLIFVDALANCMKANSNLVINIEASASKVPTETFKDNTLLAKYRAEDAAKNITDALVKKGIKKEMIKFGPYITSVNGPEYKNDFDKNDKIYEQYQFTKVSVTIK